MLMLFWSPGGGEKGMQKHLDHKLGWGQQDTWHLDKAGWLSLNICVEGNNESKKGLFVFAAK